MKNSLATIGVSTSVLGVHAWRDLELSGLEHQPPFDDVSFLKHLHHHDFHFTVEVQVEHDDREIEFLLLRRDLMQVIEQKCARRNDGGIYHFEDKSCEMLAREVATYFSEKFERSVTVVVSEDEVSYARVTVDP